MKHHCEDHDEPHHMYCPVHNRPLGAFCVAPITHFISNVKSSPAMLDLEQTLKELGSFARRFTDDKKTNIQDIQTQRKDICKEIHKIRKSLNDHLDQLQETLIRSINKTADDVTLQLGDVKNILTEI